MSCTMPENHFTNFEWWNFEHYISANNNILFLIIATILPVKCLYVERHIGIEADINGKQDEVFDDSLLPSINARKKDDFGWRRNLDNDELPPAMQNSVKGTIAELRKHIRRRSSKKASKSKINRRLLGEAPQKVGVVRREIQQKLNKLIKDGTLQKSTDSRERKSARKDFPILWESREDLIDRNTSISKDMINSAFYLIPANVPDQNIVVGRRGEQTKDPLEKILKDQKVDDDSSSRDKNSIKSSEHSNKHTDLAFDLELDPDDAMKYAIPIDVKIKGYLQIPEKDD